MPGSGECRYETNIKMDWPGSGRVGGYFAVVVAFLYLSTGRRLSRTDEVAVADVPIPSDAVANERDRHLAARQYERVSSDGRQI
jgi:hypothetical protein